MSTFLCPAVETPGAASKIAVATHARLLLSVAWLLLLLLLMALASTVRQRLLREYGQADSARMLLVSRRRKQPADGRGSA